MNNTNIALLITGTIIPNSVYVAHTNAAQRRNEYLSALNFYSALIPQAKLFFLENSAYDFTNDTELMNLLNKKNITLIKFPPSAMFEKGKGYQEFEMLDAAVRQLTDDFSLLVKVTGRYKVKNLPALLAGQCKGFLGDSQKKHSVVQTNVFACTQDFYRRHISGSYADADDSQHRFIEKVLYNKFFSNNIVGIQLFPENPLIEGISGSYGGTLRRNPLKQLVRNAERKILRLFGVNQFLIEY